MQKLKLIRNKRGGAGTIAIVIILVLIALGVLGLVYQSMVQEKKPKPAEGCPESTGALTVNAVSALNKGTTISGATIIAGVNGAPVSTVVTSGTTTFPVGSQVTILVNKSDYIDSSATFEMLCGGKVMEMPLYYSTSDNPTIRVINDENAYMTDSDTVGVNQSLLSTGESLTVTVEFKGTSLESSGDGIFIVETPANTGINISRIELDGVVGKFVPSIHPSVNAGSKIASFDVPAIEGSTTVTKSLTFVVTPTGHWSGGVLMDWYAKQDFIDDDGTIKNGVQDSDGTAKYENTLDSDFYVASV